MDFPGDSAGKESIYNVGDLGLIPRLGRSLGEGNGYPLQHSGLENSMDCIARQSPLSMGFSRQEYWNGLPCPPPGDLPNLGIKPRFPTLKVDSLPSEPPGKLINTGVGSLSLLQGIFLTQGSNPGLLHCGQILYLLSYQGSPRIPEQAAFHFSRGSSCPRNRTGVSCIASGFFTN